MKLKNFFTILTFTFFLTSTCNSEDSCPSDDSYHIKYLLDKASDSRTSKKNESKIALEKLLEIKSTGDIELLIDEFSTKNISKKIILYQIFNHLGKTASPFLKKTLRKRDEKTDLVILILGNIGDKSSRKKIRKYLDDPDRIIRKSATEALGNLKDKHSVKKLMKLTEDPWDPIRLTAIRSLEMIDDKRAVSCLIQKLNDPIFNVRFAASEALIKFKNDAEPKLEKFLEIHLEKHIKLLALKTLNEMKNGKK